MQSNRKKYDILYKAKGDKNLCNNVDIDTKGVDKDGLMGAETPSQNEKRGPNGTLVTAAT